MTSTSVTASEGDTYTFELKTGSGHSKFELTQDELDRLKAQITRADDDSVILD